MADGSTERTRKVTIIWVVEYKYRHRRRWMPSCAYTSTRTAGYMAEHLRIDGYQARVKPYVRYEPELRAPKGKEK